MFFFPSANCVCEYLWGQNNKLQISHLNCPNVAVKHSSLLSFLTFHLYWSKLWPNLHKSSLDNLIVTVWLRGKALNVYVCSCLMSHGNNVTWFWSFDCVKNGCSVLWFSLCWIWDCSPPPRPRPQTEPDCDLVLVSQKCLWDHILMGDQSLLCW